LVGIVALAGLVGACSSSSSPSGGGGAGGEAAQTGGAGASASGGTSGSDVSGGNGGATAGANAAAGSAGAPIVCAFGQDGCQTCMFDKCNEDAGACQGDDACKNALPSLGTCICGGSESVADCEATFEGTLSPTRSFFVACYDQKCATTCNPH
jgi:hypothetical protein